MATHVEGPAEGVFAERFAALAASRSSGAAPQLPEAYARTLRPLGLCVVREAPGEGASQAHSGATLSGSPTYSESLTLSFEAGRLVVRPGVGDDSACTAELSAKTLEMLAEDLEACAGLIYSDRVRAASGDLMHFMHWEPALRWLWTGRPVYDPERVSLAGPNGEVFDPLRSFRLDEDPETQRAYLAAVGYLWIRSVFSAEEVAELQAEAERLRAAAREGDQESWWGKNEAGESVLCRVLRAGKQPKMRSLHGDPRLERLASLCEVPMIRKQGPEDKDGVTLLWKQPGVREGLGDLPWHRDCGMGGHASMCPTAVQSIFLGPNTPEAGEIRFLPGSWKMSLPFAEGEEASAPVGVAPPAEPGDVTLHYGDGMHVAPPPTGTSGPFRSCVLIGYQRAGGGHHLGGRHYNDVLLGSEDGQVRHLRSAASE